MRQKILTFRLAFILAKMFLVDFYKESMKEITDGTLYPQENYSSCLERGTDIINHAIKRTLNYYTLTGANHRLCTHGDDIKEEVEELSSKLSTKEVASATRGFWMG